MGLVLSRNSKNGTLVKKGERKKMIEEEGRVGEFWPEIANGGALPSRFRKGLSGLGFSRHHTIDRGGRYTILPSHSGSSYGKLTRLWIGCEWLVASSAVHRARWRKSMERSVRVRVSPSPGFGEQHVLRVRRRNGEADSQKRVRCVSSATSTMPRFFFFFFKYTLRVNTVRTDFI